MIERIEGVRRGLAETNCDAFVSFHPPTNQYLSGFTGSTSCVIITTAEALFLCDFRYTEQAGHQATAYTVTEVTGDLLTRAAEQLAAMGVGRAAFEPANMSVAQHESLGESFPGELVGAPRMVTDLRERKSPAEIACIRAASELKEATVMPLLEGLREGTTEREFAAEIEYALRKNGASGVSFPPIVAFGEGSSLPHYSPGDRPLKKGDIVLVDCGCVLNGYCSDWTRTFCFGSIPGSWFEEIYAVTLSAQLAGLAACRPDASCREVDAAARGIIQEAGHGDHFGHGLGHGLGIEVHESPRLNPTSSARLAPGMAVTVEPGIYLVGKGGVRIEDLVIITESGHEVLTRVPKELRVL
jgi:Xaa-Pro aminopeptidase